ncbi:MAG: hypothetical protein DI535_20015 [Citrobacter freundii]|nr:MAG: hypothetical protein DI535_20015 [Citrobacter freundii]
MCHNGILKAVGQDNSLLLAIPMLSLNDIELKLWANRIPGYSQCLSHPSALRIIRRTKTAYLAHNFNCGWEGIANEKHS